MKHLKKIALFFAVVVCFAVCFFAVEASAESYSNLGYTVNNGEVIITYCNYYSASSEALLDTFLKHHAISQAQYDKSLLN